MTWQEKAHRLIAADCFAAWRDANTPRRKQHRPYTVPEQARALVECLASNDEPRAKAIFIHRAEFGITEYAA